MTPHPYAMEVSPVEPQRISTPAPGHPPSAKGAAAAGQIPAIRRPGQAGPGHPTVRMDRWGG